MNPLNGLVSQQPAKAWGHIIRPHHSPGLLPGTSEQLQLESTPNEDDALSQGSSSRSSSYSPPYDMTQTDPRIMHRSFIKAQISSLQTSKSFHDNPDDSEGSHVYPQAPWNPHRTGSQDYPYSIGSSCEDEESDLEVSPSAEKSSATNCGNPDPAPRSKIRECRSRESSRERRTFYPSHPSRMIDSYRPSTSSGLRRITVPTGPRADLRYRTKVYCEYWLRTGRCTFEETSKACRYKHEQPDERTLHEMGIFGLPPVVKRKASTHQTAVIQDALVEPLAKRTWERKEQPLSTLELTASQSQSNPPQQLSATSATTSRLSSNNSYPLSSSRSSPPSARSDQRQAASLGIDSVVDSSKSNNTEVAPTPKLEDPMSINLNSKVRIPERKFTAFEQEEELNRRRHELHMARQKEELELRLDLEFNHKKRMKEAGLS